MKFDKQKVQMLLRLLQTSGCLLMLAGCASQGTHKALELSPAAVGVPERHIKPGDTAFIHYVCKLRSGEVAAATDRVDEKEPKSNVYRQREEADTPSITAVGAGDAALTQESPYEQRSLEEEISNQLALTVVDMKEGDTRTMEIKAENAPAWEAYRYIARLTRVRTRPKEMKMPKGDYEYRAQRSPEVGQEFSYDPDFRGKVVSVSDQEVTIRFFATPGAIIDTPFGPGRIREEGQNYKVDIDAHKGALVRAGSMVGRISDVDDKIITVDFGNAFGGETLLCNVTVEKIIDAKLLQSRK